MWKHRITEGKLKVLLIAITLIYLFSVPLGNFPLGDDYAYLVSVQKLLVDNVFFIHPSATAALAFQISYGAAFSALFGLNHYILATTTILAGLVVILSTFMLVRKWFDAKIAFLGALVILTNPLFAYLSRTFMTDIPALAFALLSVVAFFRWQSFQKKRYLVLSAIFGILGFWIRQYAILPLAAIAIYFLLYNRKEFFKKYFITFFVIIPILSIVTWFFFFKVARGTIECPYEITFGLSVLKNLMQASLTFGYLLFPLGLVFILKIKSLLQFFRKRSRIYKLFLILFVLSALVYPYARFVGNTNPNPFAFELFTSSGLGVFAMEGVKATLLPSFSWTVFFTLSIIVVFGLLAAFPEFKKKYGMLYLFTIVFLLPMTLYKSFFDRYYLFLIPFLLPVMLEVLKKIKYLVPALILTIVLLGGITWYFLYDDYSWNNARWTAIGSLLNSGIQPAQIDGGFEYDAMFFKSCINPVGAVNFHGWAYSLSDQYVISSSQLDNYSTVKTFDYFGPFGEQLGTIYALKKVV